MKAAIYIRVSTPGQEDDGTSLDSQLDACRRYAAERGLHVVAVYRDVHTGSELWERDGLTELRAAVARREIAAVIIYALDRLARRAAHQIIVMAECDRHGVELHCVTEPVDTSREGELLNYVRGWMAEVEREKIRERTLRGKRARIEAGKLHGHGPELYGYRRENGRRVVVEAEAAVVRDIYDWVTRERLSVRGVARRLNEREVPTAMSGRWSKSQVYRLLTNPAYKGVTVGWRWRSRGRNRNAVIRPESEWIVVPGDLTPAIVDERKWAAAQGLIATNRADHARNERAPYLLRGCIWCAVCGRRMYAEASKGRRYYRCSSRDRGVRCGAPMTPADEVEAYVWSEVVRIVREPRLIARAAERPDRRSLLLRQRAEAERQLARIDRGIDRLLRQYRVTDDETLWDAIQRHVAEAERERRMIRERLDRLDAELSASDDAQSRSAAIAAYCERVAASILDADDGQRREAVLALGVRVEAAGQAWELSLSVPA